MDVQKQVLNGVHNAAVFQRRVRVLSSHLAAEMKNGESVLDVGCGDGSIAVAIQNHAPHLKFSGIDVFLRPQVAIPAVVYDGVTIPHPDKSFDWVTIVDVLHHCDDPGAVLAECTRVARKGVVIKDHLREGLAAGQTLRFMDWVGNRGHDVRLPYNYLSRDEWNGLFDKIGAKTLSWNERLGLYPQPFSLAFDRSLHFIGTVASIRH